MIVSLLLQFLLSNAWMRVLCFFVLILALQLFLAHSHATVAAETKRRLQHAVTGTALVLISYCLPLYFCLLALSAGCAVIWYASRYHHPWYVRTFGPLLRPSERVPRHLPGAFYFLAGTAVTAALFNMNTARYAVMVLSLADPLAAAVGQAVPSSPLRFLASSSSQATLAGSTACFGVAVVLGRFGWALDWKTVSIASLAATLAEASTVANDNLVIPIVTAAAVTLCQHQFVE